MAPRHLGEQERSIDRADDPARAGAAASSTSSVVHVIGTLDRGGAETVALDLCRALPANRFRQLFLSIGGREGSLAGDFRAAGAAVEQCRLYPRITFVPRLWRRLRDLRPDVVVAHVSLTSGLILMVARFAGVAGRVARVHSEGDGRSDTTGRRLQRFMMRRVLRWCATDVVAVTQPALDYALAPKGDRRFRVLPNGVNLARLDAIDRVVARNALALPPDAKVLVHIGRPAPEKNRRFLGAVHRAARARDPGALLVVVGAGGADDLSDFASDPSVLCLGERADIGRILAAADVLLLPSLREGLPGVVLEALACGVPVVATNLPGLREVRRSTEGMVLLELAAGADRWAERALELAVQNGKHRDQIRSKFLSSPFLLDKVISSWAHLFRRRRPAVPAAVSLGLMALLAVVLAFPGLTTAESFAGQAGWTFIAWVAGLAVLARSSDRGVYSGAVAYLLLLGLFHGGLLFSIALRGEGGLNVLQRIWLYAGHTGAAARLSVLGMLSFAVAAGFGTVVWRPKAGFRQALGASSSGRAASSQAFGGTGLALQLLGLVLLLTTVQGAGGLQTLARGYVAFLRRVDGYWLGYGILFLCIGTVLGVAAGGRWRVAAWLLFGLFALASFPLGGRGAALFPFVVLVLLEARRGHRLRPLVAGGLVLALLMLITVVRSSRLGGVGALRYASWAVSPLDAVAEMGHSLKPVVVVLGWHAKGEPFRHGVTYIAVPLRVIERWTGWHGGPPAVDHRLFHQEIFSRVSAIGGSPVAEGYHNFGVLGVLAALALIGAVIGALDARHSTPLADAVFGVTLIPLLTGVRNSAASVLPHVILGLTAVGVAWILLRVSASAAARKRRRLGGVALEAR